MLVFFFKLGVLVLVERFKWVALLWKYDDVYLLFGRHFLQRNSSNLICLSHIIHLTSLTPLNNPNKPSTKPSNHYLPFVSHSSYVKAYSHIASSSPASSLTPTMLRPRKQMPEGHDWSTTRGCSYLPEVSSVRVLILDRRNDTWVEFHCLNRDMRLRESDQMNSRRWHGFCIGDDFSGMESRGWLLELLCLHISPSKRKNGKKKLRSRIFLHLIQRKEGRY